jgi:hypothetical protein
MDLRAVYLKPWFNHPGLNLLFAGGAAVSGAGEHGQRGGPAAAVGPLQRVCAGVSRAVGNRGRTFSSLTSPSSQTYSSLMPPLKARVSAESLTLAVCVSESQCSMMPSNFAVYLFSVSHIGPAQVGA